MSSTSACPVCGSPLTFRAETSLSIVCRYCSNIVVREDAKLEAVGKTNEVLVSGSALRLGLDGRHHGQRFTLIGRIQLRHDAGGLWDEWLVRFSNGKLAWLADHQGTYALLVERVVHDAPRIDSHDEAQPGRKYRTSIGNWVVVENGIATVVAQDGELRDRVVQDARRPFVDLAGHPDRFGTLDFGTLRPDGTREAKRFFVGRELSASELKLPRAERTAASLPASKEGKVARCPHCGAPVSMRRKDTESLSCRSCDTVLSVERDETLAILFKQHDLRHKSRIRLGKTALLDAGFFVEAPRARTARPWPTQLAVTVVAHLVRSLRVDSQDFTYDEYLLDGSGEGFFWLIESDGRWMFARRLPAGLVEAPGNVATLDDRRFLREQVANVRVEQVTGELYWRAKWMDRSTVTDYRRSPFTLSCEGTKHELIWTECLDVPSSAMKRVFGVRPLRSETEKASTIAGVVLVIFVVVVCFIAIRCADSDEDGTGRGYSGGSGGYHFGK